MENSWAEYVTADKLMAPSQFFLAQNLFFFDILPHHTSNFDPDANREQHTTTTHEHKEVQMCLGFTSSISICVTFCGKSAAMSELCGGADSVWACSSLICGWPWLHPAARSKWTQGARLELWEGWPAEDSPLEGKNKSKTTIIDLSAVDSLIHSKYVPFNNLSFMQTLAPLLLLELIGYECENCINSGQSWPKWLRQVIWWKPPKPQRLWPRLELPAEDKGASKKRLHSTINDF